MPKRGPKFPDYYETLDLPFPIPSLTPQQLKLAYHKALLKHHPDKAAINPDIPSAQSTSTQPTAQKTRPYTIDQITTAYKTLSNCALRKSYDSTLREVRTEHKKTGAFHTGLEPVDLEDFECEEWDGGSLWYRACRCGEERGFVVREEDLEDEVEAGEVVVGCRGCSLWVKVLFAVQDDGPSIHDGPWREGYARGEP